jgi:hypothetical protein
MKKLFVFLIGFSCLYLPAAAQELYVNSEPASNMAAKSVGIRFNNICMNTTDNRLGWRFNPEIMFGLSNKWMWHISGFFSNLYQPAFQFEGLNTYIKYRFYANDGVHTHFRMAAYGRASLINNPVTADEINLEGDNTGIAAGLIATKLLHKLALSVSVGYDRAMNNLRQNKLPSTIGRNALNYTLSTGMLVFPRIYTSYKQTNMNIFLEFIGQSNLNTGRYYLSAAPAIQFIFDSRTRIDISYRMQMAANMNRFSNNSLLFRVEYNIFNAYK